MSKLVLNKPVLIMLYGFPGAGKTYLARQLCDDVQIAHVQEERIRQELFEDPRFDQQENQIVNHLMNYMTTEFLQAGVSVVYDTNLMRVSQRREIRQLAKQNKAETLLVWIQIDHASAFSRANKRDRRRTDDKYTPSIDENRFNNIVKHMQNPELSEDNIVVSGKHNYSTQRNTILKKMFDMGLSMPSNDNSKVVKPGLVNLIPNYNNGRVDASRRNINVR